MAKIIYLSTYSVISTNGADLSVCEWLEKLNKENNITKVVSLVQSKNKNHFKKIINNWKKRFDKPKFYDDKLEFYYNKLPIINFFLDDKNLIKDKIKSILEEFKPDLIIFRINDLKIWLSIKNNKTPHFILITNNEYISKKQANFEQKKMINESSYFFTISKFLQNSFEKEWGKKPSILYQLIPIKNYLVNEKKENYISFINPAPIKGVKIVIALANLLPNKKFLIIGGWNKSIRENFKKRFSIIKNITYMEPELDMKIFYSNTKILLVPSLWEEGFGRVIIEAYINGIPVLASNKGGIKEIINNKSNLIEIYKEKPMKFINIWVNKLKELDENQKLYKHNSLSGLEKAKEYKLESKTKFTEFQSLITQITKQE